MSRRDNIVRAARALVPSDWGDEAFATIVHGSYSPGFGTTCGYAPIEFLYLAGCRDPRVLNYAAPDEGLTYVNGQNLSRLVYGGRAAGAFVDGADGIRPGDIYYVSDGSSYDSEHVGTYLGPAEGGGWEEASAGQTNAAGNQCARIRVRAVRGASFGDGRTVRGYLDVDRLEYSAAPSGAAAGGSSGGGGVILAALVAAGAWWKFGRGR